MWTSEEAIAEAHANIIRANNFLKQGMIYNAHGGAFSAIFYSIQSVMLKQEIEGVVDSGHDYFMAEFKKLVDKGCIPARFYDHLVQAGAEKGYEFTEESVARHIIEAEECFNWAQQTLGC